MTTMLQTYRGGSAVLVPDVALKVDGPRYNALVPPGAGTTVTLPDATWLRPGPRRYVLHNRSATDAVAIRCADGSTSPQGATSIAAGMRVDCHLIGNATANGTWLCRQLSNAVQTGTALADNRFAMEFNITSSTSVMPSLRVMAIKKYPDWNQLQDAAIRLNIAAGVVIGSDSPQRDAITSSYFFGAGTKLLIVNEGSILGCGGPGGRGGSASLLAADGGTGGNALRVYMPTVILNYGVIAGGGGGGGGGVASGVLGGGGGGGGAGYNGGVGGAGGQSGGMPGEPGRGSYPGVPGRGGYPGGSGDGGLGGALGAAGVAAGGAGGAAGTPWIVWTGGTASVTCTNIGGGVTYGTPGTF